MADLGASAHSIPKSHPLLVWLLKSVIATAMTMMLRCERWPSAWRHPATQHPE
jgi:hypothetical protein